MGVVSLAVVDASLLTAFYTADDPRRVAVFARLAVGDWLLAPAHLDAPVLTCDARLVAATGPRCAFEMIA